MDERKDTAVEALLEHLIEHGPGDIATVFGRAFELAMQIERERFLRAGPCERTAGRRGHANGYKPKRIDTPAGTVTVQVPKTADHDGDPFYPQSLERGRRKVTRRDAGGGGDLHQGRVDPRGRGGDGRVRASYACPPRRSASRRSFWMKSWKPWRTRPLGEIRYLILDARLTRRCATAGSSATPPRCRHRPGRAPPGARRLGRPLRGGGPLAGLSGEPPGPRPARGRIRGLRRPRPACAPPAGPGSAARHGSAASSTSPGTPSITRRASRSASASAPSCAPSGTQPPRRRQKPPSPSSSRPAAIPPRSSRMAGGERPRGPGRLLAPGAAPPTAAHLQSHGARRPPGAQAPHRQGPGLSRRRRPRAPRLRHPRRDRREMGLRHQGLHQVGSQDA